MAEPVLSSSYPSDGEADVYINKSLTFTFTEELDSTTVNDETFFLFNAASNEREPVTVGYDSTLKRVTLVLSRHLKENTAHRVIIVGNDRKIVDVLKSSDGTALGTSLEIEFSTGTNVYDIDSVIEKEAQNITLEGDLFLPSNIKALGNEFTVAKVRPYNHQGDVPQSLNGSNQIVFTFSKNLLTGQSITDYIQYESYPILDTVYYGMSGSYDTGFSPPEGSLAIESNKLILTFSGYMPNNAGIEIQLTDNIKSEDNEQYGGDMRYVVSTERYPLIFSPKVIRRELRVLPTDEIYDDYIAYLLFKNTILIWEKTSRTLDLSNPSWAFKKYVLYATIVDLIEDLDFEKYLSSGNRRQVGDLNVSYDSLIGRVAMKLASASKNKDVAFQTIFAGWDFATVVPSDATIDRWSRLWYDVNGRYTNPLYKFFQPNIPASNTSVSRHAKTTNPYRFL